MSGDSFEFNVHGTGENAQINQGQTVHATQNNGEQLPSPEAVIEKVVESLPEDVATQWQEQIRPLAALPIAEQQQPEIASKIMAICEQIRPHAGVVWKNLAIFGATALDTLANRNPIVAGVVQVCKANSGVA